MKNESLEELKSIIDNAPEGATHLDDINTYWKVNSEFDYYFHDGNQWDYSEPLENGTRSLSDIKRIIELIEDEKRLDHLQKCNQIFNGRAGSNYGWRVDWNHNRIAILDTGLKGVTIRNAIDEHIKKMGDL